MKAKRWKKKININNTLVYTQLIEVYDDEYITKVAHSLKEDQELSEVGFEYVTDRDYFKIYRKRK